jgi:hypothetical protein
MTDAKPDITAGGEIADDDGDMMVAAANVWSMDRPLFVRFLEL